MAVVTDASERALDGVIDAAFAGETGEVENEFSKARASGSSPAAIVSAAIRQVANLHKMKLAVEGGEHDRIRHEARGAAGAFQRANEVGEALRVWSPARLLRAMEQLAEASLDMRRNAATGRDDRAAHAAVDRGERAKKA